MARPLCITHLVLLSNMMEQIGGIWRAITPFPLVDFLLECSLKCCDYLNLYEPMASTISNDLHKGELSFSPLQFCFNFCIYE